MIIGRTRKFVLLLMHIVTMIMREARKVGQRGKATVQGNLRDISPTE